jgi:pimeloyl-ACP methyl ester carboxylesterase
MHLLPLNLLPWQYPTAHGFTLRGWHSPPSGKPVLHFLHGNSFCGLVYLPMLQVLNAHFDLWLCDAQGHGDTDLGGTFKGWNTNATVAVEAFQHHLPMFAQVPRFAVGHSFGGVLTGLITSTNPSLFERAVMLDPVIFPPGMAWVGEAAQVLGLTKHAPLAKASRKRRQHWPSREAAVDALRGRGTYRGWTEPALAAFAEHALRPADDGHGVVLKCPPSREAEVFGSVPKGLWSALQKVRTPTLVLHASNTFPFIKPSALRWAQHNRHVSLVEINGGHCFMQCAPELAAAQVRAFLTKAD